MHIQALQLKHTLHFSDIQLQFNYPQCPVTLILGNQGTGKTTLLRFSYQALTWFAARYRDSRAAGLVMQDQDIMQNRLQSKIDIRIGFPEDMGSLPESSQSEPANLQSCSWQIYKTLNSQGLGFSKAETSQLESVLSLYHKARLHDPLLGLPLIAYYPAERFTNEVNLLSKNNPAILQSAHAYEIAAIPFTTFARFFEWFREISDIENAQTTDLVNRLIANQHGEDPHQDLSAALINAYNQMHAPSLTALKDTLATIFPELTNIYLQYLPKLQLMVTYKGKSMMFQQLSNSLKNWIALVGDIVRRLCLLNTANLYPCLEGEGILLIDEIDQQLDQDECATILARLNKAFPHVQIIVTGNRTELLENASDYQCLQLENQQLHPVLVPTLQAEFDEIYQNLNLNLDDIETDISEHIDHLQEPLDSAQSFFELIRENLNEDQQKNLIFLLNNRENASLEHKLHE